jgi:hypothetical protein
VTVLPHDCTDQALGEAIWARGDMGSPAAIRDQDTRYCKSQGN